MFIYRSYIYKFHGSELLSSGDNGGLVIWRPCGVGGLNPTEGKIFFCNVELSENNKI